MTTRITRKDRRDDDRKRDRLTPNQARAARRARRQLRRRLTRGLAFTVVALVAFLFIFSLIAPNVFSVLPTRAIPEDGQWQRIENQGRTHIAPGEEHPAYNSIPATSGWHYNIPNIGPVPWRAYTEPLSDESLVHNLEHGGIGMHYNCPDGCPDLVAQLLEIRDEARRVILSPYPGMDTRIALTAWDYIDKFDEFDENRIRSFISAHLDSGHAPESGVR